MKISDALQVVIYPGLALLPKQMSSPAAIVMLLTIGMQESRFIHRRQIGGPARGFYQFEKKGGVAGVLLHHHRTSPLIRDALDRLQYDFDLDTSYNAIEHNDALATVYARLLLWTLPDTLPQKTNMNDPGNNTLRHGDQGNHIDKLGMNFINKHGSFLNNVI